MPLHPSALGEDGSGFRGRNQAADAAIPRILPPFKQAALHQAFDCDGSDAALDAANRTDIPRRVVFRIVRAEKQNVKARLVDAVLFADRCAQIGIDICQLPAERDLLQ